MKRMYKAKRLYKAANELPLSFPMGHAGKDSAINC
jgi:hypothetical protein